MKLRLMLKIGSYRILCPERYDLEQIIKFASKLKLIKEQGYFSTPTKFVPSEGEEIKFELIPEDSIEGCTPVKVNVTDGQEPWLRVPDPSADIANKLSSALQ